MDSNLNSLVRQYILSVAKQYPDLIAAYLFGSYATNRQNTDSDIDIALIFDKLEDSEKFDKQVQFMLLASQFDTRIEPHPISKEDLFSNNPFVSEIKKTGIEITVF